MDYTQIKLADDFYEDFSFVHDFGYSAEEEITRTADLLKSFDIEPNEKNVMATLENIKKINRKLKTDYKQEVEQYTQWRADQRIIGNEAPLIIELSRAILVAIIGAVVASGTKWYLDHASGEDAPLKDLLNKFSDDDEELIWEVKKSYRLRRKKKD